MQEPKLTFPKRGTHSAALSRRRLLLGGAAVGVSSAVGLATVAARPASAQANDVEILNTALFYEHEAIWAYSYAAGRLSSSPVGQAVLEIGLANRSDHMEHRDTLRSVIRSLGGTPVETQTEYDLSAYLERGDGGIDSDVNIAKLALALEVDAAIAYGMEAAQLQTPDLVMAAVSIAANESAHATAIRAAFVSLGIDVPVVPAAYVSGDTRPDWIIPV